MMILQPEQVIYYGPSDVIDYVTRGLPPTRKNFDRLMEAVKTAGEEDVDFLDPDVEENEDSNEVGNNLEGKKKDSKLTIRMSGRGFAGYDKEAFQEVMERVYRNNVRNRNIALCTAGAVSLIVIGSLIHGKKKKKDDGES